MSDEYNNDLLPELQFTQAEIDMVYFACLAFIGHPQTEDHTYSDEGFATLLVALTKIQTWCEGLMLDGEPDVVSPG